jgi:hypothetical protein
MNRWNVFSNHGHVLLFLARHPDARLRDVAANVGITERAVQKIVRDMQDSGVVRVTRVGRRNRYAIDGQAPLQHALEEHRSVGQLIDLIAGAEKTVEADEARSPDGQVGGSRDPQEPDAEPPPRDSREDRPPGPASDPTPSPETPSVKADPAAAEPEDLPDAGEQRPLF